MKMTNENNQWEQFSIAADAQWAISKIYIRLATFIFMVSVGVRVGWAWD